MPSHTPLSLQRQNRLWVFFQSPYVGGKSRQGAPVRNIHNTALINKRLSLAIPPQLPLFPERSGDSFIHISSDMSCLLYAAIALLIIKNYCSSLIYIRDDTL